MDYNRWISLVDTLTADNGNRIVLPSGLIRYEVDNRLSIASLELDHTGPIISYEEYFPLGCSSYRSGRNTSEITLKRYRYVGEERDKESGLYYYGARYYTAWLARFVSVDPLKDDYPQLNPYNYAGNEPVGDLDLNGLQGTKTEKRNPKVTSSSTTRILENGLVERVIRNQFSDQIEIVTEILDSEGNVLDRKFEDEGVRTTSLADSKKIDSIQQIIDFISSLESSNSSSNLQLLDTSETKQIKKILSQSERNLMEFGQELNPNTRFVTIPENRPNDDFTFTIATGDIGAGGGGSGSIAFIEFSEDLENIFAGQSGIITGLGFGFNVGIEAGVGTGFGNFTNPLDPFENPLQKIAESTSFDLGFGLPIGPVGSNFTTVQGLNGSEEVFRATFQTISIGLSMKKIDPLIDRLPFPSIQNTTFNKIIKDLPTPTENDSLMIEKKIRNRK